MRRADALRLARDSNFRALWIGQLISIFGDRFHYLALLALIVERAGDPRNPAPELAAVPIVSFLPAILLGPMTGALVDLWNTRRVLIVSDAVRGVLVLALIPIAGIGGIPAAFGIVFLLYTANAFFLPARSAILPDLVPAEALVAANSLATLAGVIATLAGALLGGMVIERVGWRWGFAIDAATYFVSVAALAMIHPPPRVVTHSPVALRDAYRNLGRSVVEGARIASRQGRVLGSLGALALLWAAGGALHVGGTILVRERMAGVVSGVGALLATTGLGMVAGTLLLSAWGKGYRGRALAAGSLLLIGAALVAFAIARSVVALHAVAFIAGLGVAILLVTTEASIQRAVEPEARGRVFALRDFLTRLSVLSSALLCGWLLGRGWVRPGAAVLAAGILLLVASLFGLFGPGQNRPTSSAERAL